MNKAGYNSKKLGIMALLVSLGIVLQIAENYIVITPVPGGKLGLGNIISIINIFLLGGSNAMIVAFVRAFLGTMLMGGVSALPYSIAGALLSTAGMWMMKKLLYPRISMIGMSVIGASLHNFSQVCVASIIFASGYIFSYLPVLLVLSVISGTVTGIAAQVFGNRIFLKDENVWKKE